MANPVTIKFECSGCGQSLKADESAQFEKATCPTCQHVFFSVARRAVTTPATAQIVRGNPPQFGSAAKVKAQAESFCKVVVLFVIIGVLALLLGICMSVGADAPGGSAAWVVMVAYLSAAVLLSVMFISAPTQRNVQPTGN